MDPCCAGKTLGCRIGGHLSPLIFVRNTQVDPCPLCCPFPHQPHHLFNAGMAPSVAGSKVSSQRWQKLPGFPQVSSPFLGIYISWLGSCMTSTGLPGDAPSSMPEGAVQSLNAKQLLIFKFSVIYCQNKG